MTCPDTDSMKDWKLRIAIMLIKKKLVYDLNTRNKSGIPLISTTAENPEIFILDDKKWFSENHFLWLSLCEKHTF